MARRPSMSGRGTFTLRVKRPGRSTAWSRVSMRLVAAITTIDSDDRKPSISARSWFRACSRSSLELLPPRVLARASISSTKMMALPNLRATAKSSRTRLAPTPTYISTKPEPEIDTKATPASVAAARASIVLPVPGGPYSSKPRGMLAPRARNRSGNFRNSTTSVNSSLASSQPATSAKRVGRATAPVPSGPFGSDGRTMW